MDLRLNALSIDFLNLLDNPFLAFALRLRMS